MTARKPSIKQRLRYRFDNSLARGPLVLMGWLAVVVFVVVLLAAAVGRFLLGDNTEGNFFDNVWQSLLWVFDPGALDLSAWPSRLLWFIVALLGILVGGSLIGLIAAALDKRMEDLREGRSPVLERRHTLVLGWSPRLPVIVSELAIANENLTRPAIVILANRPVGEMSAELRDRAGDTRNTRVVCRSGDPWDTAHLQLTNIAEARSVIVLTGAEGDTAVVKTLLAVKTLDPDFSGPNVVIELAYADHARSLRTITAGTVCTVSSDYVIAQVTAQACHQAGLSVVFRELLNFSGHDCYFADKPDLAGHTYGEALLAFDSSSPIGRLTADGVVQLNPPSGTTFGPGDQIIAIAWDDSTLRFTGFRTVEVPEAASPGPPVKVPLRVLIVGWSSFGPTVVQELDEFLAPGSSIELAINRELADPTGLDQMSLVNAALHITVTEGGPEGLLRLGELGLFDQVIVLGYRDRMPADDADALTLLSLLTLRRLWPADMTPKVLMIVQMLNQANAELAETVGVDDFIVSEALASLMLAQLSERAELQAVFDRLFDPTDAVVELRPAYRFVSDAVVRYEQIVAAGAAQSVSVFGWRIDATGQVVINPPKNREVHLVADDQVLLVGPRGT